MSDREYWRWIVETCTETASLLFLWRGVCTFQPVLMPGFTYYWWRDDPAETALYEAAEDDGGRRGRYDVH